MRGERRCEEEKLRGEKSSKESEIERREKVREERS
jgi:hypothetical protein